MIQLTLPAAQALASQFSGSQPRTIRVYLEDMGCSSMQLALALDTARENDRSYDQDGFTLVINEELAEAVGTVTIDSGQFGFTISSEKSVTGGGCGC